MSSWVGLFGLWSSYRYLRGEGMALWELRLEKQQVNERKRCSCWTLRGLMVLREAAALALMYKPVFGQY